MTFQQMCKDVHLVKTNGQQVFIESRNRPAPRKNTSAGEINGDNKNTSVSFCSAKPQLTENKLVFFHPVQAQQASDQWQVTWSEA